MSKKICDIIVPIYNAYEDTVKCVNSVLDNTDKDMYRLILINDKSPDVRIEEYLNGLKHENIIVLHNEKNKGFVGTVNRGMQYSINDVLLLNSDTIVTKNWLNKIIECAYSDNSIATVTPLTNNGTICSIPNFLEDNVIPEGFLLTEYSEMVEEISLKKYPELVTGVGFCMFIKRSVLDVIGYFDEESFGKGYGEENDFCCRCIEHGYINVLCDDTFILHTGSMSFKEDKAKYVEENLKVLFEKYPYYNPNVQKFINENPLKDIHDNIKLHIKLRQNHKKNVLYLIHNGILEDINDPRGGTEFHLLDLVNSLEDYNKYVLVSTGKKLYLSAFVDGEIFKFTFDLNEEITTLSIENRRYEDIIKSILNCFKIDLIHVQHFKRHIINIPKIAKELGIPSIITLHDFYAICPTVNLLDSNGNYCVNSRGSDECHRCIKKRLGYNTDIIGFWNEKVSKILSEYDYIVTPSESAKNILNNYYKTDKLDIKVIEHGCKSVYLNKPLEDRADKNFNVAFIGGLAPYKGSGIIHELVKECKDTNIKWHLFGNLGDQRLNLLEKDNLIKHGRYDRESVQQILLDNNIDLICIFSIWPETYVYTLTESLQAGVPVMVYDIGALGERVRKYDAGWVIDRNAEPEALLSHIGQVKNNKTEYNSKKRNIENLKFKTNLEMANEYSGIYNALISKSNKEYNVFDGQSILMSYRRANINIESTNSELTLELYNQVNALQNELNTMKSTVGWKLLDRLRMRSPKVIKFLKKIIYLFTKKGYK